MKRFIETSVICAFLAIMFAAGRAVPVKSTSASPQETIIPAQSEDTTTSEKEVSSAVSSESAKPIETPVSIELPASVPAVCQGPECNAATCSGVSCQPVAQGKWVTVKQPVYGRFGRYQGDQSVLQWQGPPQRATPGVSYGGCASCSRR